jgi:hypothetical protein
VRRVASETAVTLKNANELRHIRLGFQNRVTGAPIPVFWLGQGTDVDKEHLVHEADEGLAVWPKTMTSAFDEAASR